MKILKQEGKEAVITVSGAGIIQVDSSSLLKTDQAKRQIQVLDELRNKIIVTSRLKRIKCEYI